jgi:hypothetical protein
MEPEELKSAWQSLDRQLKRDNAISLALYSHHKLTTARSSLRPLVWGQALQLFMGIVVVLLAAMLWSTKPDALPVIVAGVIVHAYGIVCIIAAGVMLNGIRSIDYAGSVLEMQDRLARVRRAYVVSGIFAGLPWWFLWIPFLVVLMALAHVNLYAHAPSVVWFGMAVGVAGLLAMGWLYKYSRSDSRPRLRRFVDEAMVGRSLLRAQAQLDEIQQFTQEQA